MVKSVIKGTLSKTVVTVMLLTFGTSVTCIAQDEDDTPWPYPFYDRGVQSLMKGLHEEWRQSDGETTFEIANKLIWALLLDPNELYAEFSSDTIGFRYFAERIDGLVFTNHNDTTTMDLENLKKVSIWRLENMTYDVEPKYLTIHQEMIESLKRVKVSFVD